MGELRVARDVIEEIAARLDLRAPNRDALETIAAELSRYYDVDGNAPPFEGVVVSATGVGKTYIMAAAIEYFAHVADCRHFAVITPGRTILEKTVANFTPGHPKSLLGGMEIQPVVITAENFASPAMRTAMDDPDQVKLYVFTVQALTRPTTKTGRRTHEFQEGLGDAFYRYLQARDDLIVFADEHHCYYGPAFSAAVRDLKPYALIGLTATPHPRTPEGQIIFKYPLIAAVADRLVKTPVIVGRKDERTDPLTQLTDGVRLLELKRAALERWYETHPDAPRVHPVMLVVARNIQDAEEYASILRSDEFMGGAYREAVLTVHSDAPDEALAALERVESPDSPVRIIIAVGMLKEGWDVKNVYVLASMRASVSEILTEQTLGRGLRLPFGSYTGIDMLDTLEVLAHERYEELLRRAGVLQEQLVDYRTRTILQYTPEGRPESFSRERIPIVASIPVAPLVQPQTNQGVPIDGNQGPGAGPGMFAIQSVDEYLQDQVRKAQRVASLFARGSCLPIQVPRLVMRGIQSPFSLADIVDLEPFRSLGRTLAVDPDAHLRRTKLEARIVSDPTGMRRTQIVLRPAEERVESTVQLRSLDGLRAELVSALMHAATVPARRHEIAAAERIVDAFLEGLGDKAQLTLSSYLSQASARLVNLVTEEARRIAPSRVEMSEVVDLVSLPSQRVGREEVSEDRTGEFRRGIGYIGWKRSVFEQVWFDSSPERDLANILDDADEVECWVRLERGDLPILWTDTGNWYNPDFLVVEKDRTHWLLEVKQDRMMEDESVRKKRQQAERWVTRVNLDEKVDVTWRYLLIPERAVRDARGSWEMVKRLALAEPRRS